MPPALVLALVLAQDLPAEARDAAKLARIRQALAETPVFVIPTFTPGEGPVFRVTVFARKADTPMWNNWSPVPSNIRPWFHADHHEFLEQVTTEQFRSATLNPVGIPVLPAVEFLAKSVKGAHRKRQQADAKEEVRKALEELLACRADPAKPGC